MAAAKPIENVGIEAYADRLFADLVEAPSISDIVAIRVAYPKSQAAVFDPVGAAMGKCLAKAVKH